MNKEIKKLLIVIIFLGIADGMFYNLQELWLSSNNMSLTTISRVLSLGALITVSVIFLCSNIVRAHKIKGFVVSLMIVRIIALILLYILYQSGYNVLIKFFTIVDYAVEVEIYASIYPLMSMVTKDDKLFAKKKLVYEIFYYLAAILTGNLIGKTVLSYNINYNSYTIISIIAMIIGIISLIKVNLPKTTSHRKNVLFSVIEKIKTDKISKLYLTYAIFNDISYYSLIGMLLSSMINILSFNPTVASNIKLISCILAVIIGTLILYKLTAKNNVVNISIKLVGRIISYLLPIIYLNKYTIIIGLAYTVLTSSSYAHVTDAPYINRYSGADQLAFANLTEMIGYFSKSIGTLLCGFGIAMSIRYNFIIAFIFTIVSYTFAILSYKNLKKERG